MRRTSKLLFAAMAVATAAISALPGEETTTASSDPTKVSLTVEKGNPSGSYAAGTVVTISAEAPKAGAQFAGWTGDVAILANPSLPTTTATVPFMAVTVTATYTAPATDSPPTSGPATYTAPETNSLSKSESWAG
jgi:hypothetical protein